MRMQVILDSSFARPGSAPIWSGKKGEFRDWTNVIQNLSSPPRGIPYKKFGGVRGTIKDSGLIRVVMT